MIQQFRAWIQGSWIALTTPLWLQPDRLASLLRPGDRSALRRRGARETARAAAAALVRLSSLPASPWRSTCLYRSVAVCRSLRACGVAARVQLGARGSSHDKSAGAGGGGHEGISTHAWVEVYSTHDAHSLPRVMGSPSGHTPFRRDAGPPG